MLTYNDVHSIFPEFLAANMFVDRPPLEREYRLTTKKKKSYTKEFKLKVLASYDNKGDKSVHDVAKIYGIIDQKVHMFLRQRREGRL